MIQRQCPCGVAFTIPLSYAKRPRGGTYCSKSCKATYEPKKRNGINKTCIICNKSFYVMPNRQATAKTCSRICYHQSHTTHKLSKTRLYSIWRTMKQRTQNPNNTNYKNYGGKGVKVCDRWQSFDNFHQDMKESYDEHLLVHGTMDTTLERFNVNGDYEPINCGWATKKEQRNNQRKTKH